MVVEYSETDYRFSFGAIILEMIIWGKTHREKIMKAMRNGKNDTGRAK